MDGLQTSVPSLGAPLRPGERLLVACVTVLAPALGLLTAFFGDALAPYAFVLAGLLATVAVPLGVAAARGRLDVFEPILVANAVYLLYFGVIPMIDIATRNTVYFGLDVKPQIRPGLILLVPGLLAMSVGYYSSFGTLLAGRLPKPARNGEGAIPFAFILAGAAAIAFGLFLARDQRSLLTLITLGQLGVGLDAETADPSAFNNYLKSAINVFVPAFMILFAFLKRQRWLLVPAFVLLLAVYVSLGFRFRVLILLVAPVVFLYLRWWKRPSARSAIVGITILCAVVGAIGAIRREVKTAEKVESITIAEVVMSFSKAAALYQSYVMIVDAFPQRHDFVYFLPLTYTVSHPIPRALWLGKPEAPIRTIVRSAFESDVPVSAGVAYVNAAEYYASFGVPGLIAGMFVFGALLRMMYDYLRRFPDNTWVAMIFSIGLPYVVQAVSRGYIVQTVVEVVFFFGPVLFLMWRQRWPSRRLRPATVTA